MNRRSFLTSTLAIAAALGLPQRTAEPVPERAVVTSGWVTTSHIACHVLTTAKIADGCLLDERRAKGLV